MRFYTTEQIGNTRSLTTEGFLVCHDVPIARTGIMTYGPDEVPINAGPDGVVYIERAPEDVFRPETVASFNGKPFVDEHPEDDVTPANWRKLAMGTVINPHRGAGAFDDLMIADIVVTDPATIKHINEEGKIEISCGYDADYVETSPGHGRQVNIVGNHVALVDSGRCGSRCAIGDAAMEPTNKGELKMKFKEWLAKVKEAFAAKDETKVKSLLETVPAMATRDDDDPAPGGAGGIHLHMEKGEGGGRGKFTDEELEKRFKAYDDMHAQHDKRHAAHDADISELKKHAGMDDDASEEAKMVEGQLEEEAPPGTGDKARKAKDSAYMQDSFQSAVALAEIIMPGIRIPTFDRAADPKKTFKDVCGLRRKALQLASKDPSNLLVIDQIRQGRNLTEDELGKMPCSSVRDLFNALGAMKKVANNSRATASAITTGGTSSSGKNVIRTAGDLNKRNAEYYKQ